MSLYFKYLKIHIKSDMQYKVSFLLSLVTQFINLFLGFFTIECLFSKFSNIRGFTLYEVLLAYGIIMFGFSFCETFFRGIDQFDDLIIDGSFDKLLLRPRPIMLQIFGEYIATVRSVKVLESLFIIIYALINLNLNLDIYKVITLIFMIISSVIIFLGLFILSAAYCFITIKGLEFRNVFTDGCKHMAQYPIGIFRKGIIFVLTYILPFGCVNYYPLLYILGKVTNKLYVLSPLIVIIYFIPCLLIFYKLLGKYKSTGG